MHTRTDGGSSPCVEAGAAVESCTGDAAAGPSFALLPLVSWSSTHSDRNSITTTDAADTHLIEASQLF